MGLTVHWDVIDAKSILADRQKLRLILTNLFDNAVSYTGSEGKIRRRPGVHHCPQHRDPTPCGGRQTCL